MLGNDQMVVLHACAQGCLLVGPPGTGKTLLGTHFLACPEYVCGAALSFMVLPGNCSKQHDA